MLLNALGITLIGLPFAVITFFCVRYVGWKNTLKIFALTTFIVTSVFVGADLSGLEDVQCDAG